MHTDPIADMLTRIRNAQMVKKSEVVLPFSKIKFNIASVLSKNGWLGNVETMQPLLNSEVKAKNRREKDAKFKQIRIELLYKKDGTPKLELIERVSKPGRRIYVSYKEIPQVLNGFGISLISTSKGLMTNIEAKKEKVGGEIICKVY